MTDNIDGKWSTPPLKAAWFDDEHGAHEQPPGEQQRRRHSHKLCHL
jgi:hypothetical protein